MVDVFWIGTNKVKEIGLIFYMVALRVSFYLKIEGKIMKCHANEEKNEIWDAKLFYKMLTTEGSRIIFFLE